MEDDHVVRNETSERASAQPWDQWFQAFRNLVETLNRARAAPDSERGRYVSELTAVATFISTFDRQLGHRFFDFASRLGDLDKGRDDDFLYSTQLRFGIAIRMLRAVGEAERARCWRSRR